MAVVSPPPDDDLDADLDRRLARDRRRVGRVAHGVERAALGLAFVLIFIGFRQLESKQSQIDHVIQRQQENRKELSAEMCGATNRNAAAVNVTIDYINGLILNGVKQSKAFEPVFRQLGLPPYKDRLADAQRQADGLKALKVPTLSCEGFLDKIAQVG